MSSISVFFKKTIGVAVALILIHISASAQKKETVNDFSPHFRVAANGGSSLFFGDIKQYKWWPTANYNSERKAAGGIAVYYQAVPSVAVGVQALYGGLSGTRREIKTYFETDYIETDLNMVVNLNNLFGKYRPNRLFSVYGTIGVGLMQYNTAVKNLTTGETLKKVGYGHGKGIGGRTLQGILLYGLGLNFNINNHWEIQLESANRTMDSDMLDGTVSGYALDVYNYTSLGVTYKFGFLKPKNQKLVVADETDPDLTYIPVIKDQSEADDDETQTDESISEIEQESTENNEHAGKPEMEYRVQIMAKFKGPLSINYISTKYIIPKYEIREEIYNGHFIYTVGSFETYEEARQKRDELRRLYGITDAFVVVFDEGSRLEVMPENNK